MQIDFPKSLGYTREMTPIIKILSDANYNLWLKRDDMTGVELSGNKIRKLDFLGAEAIKQGATALFTCGGLQSNHCRATAFLGAKLGLETILFLRGSPEVIPTGNHFLDQLVNATLIYVSSEEYKSIDEIMIQKANEYNSEGKKAYIIPEGGSNETGAWGYCRCFCEILDQIKRDQLPIEAIVVATGSGGTHAGLLIGKLLKQSSIEIISVNVCDDAGFFRKKILNIIKSFEQKYNHHLNLQESDITIYDGFVGGGYALIAEEEIDIIKRFAQNHGIILDPVYTAKAYLGLEKMMRLKKLEYKNILFIHTGGIYGVFPFSNQFY